MHAEYYHRRQLRKRYDRARTAEFALICIIASLASAFTALWIALP
jgi:hypothetical protein